MTIKEARTLAGWSQATLSKKLDISKRTIENWEAGVRVPPPWAERLIVAEIKRKAKIKDKPFKG